MIATCGHEVTDEGNRLIIGEYTESNERCLSSVVYCDECTKYSYEEGIVMETPEQEDRWLHGYKIRYSTNWMGPVSMKWYKDRGLTKKMTLVMTENSLMVKHGDKQPGDTIEVDDIIENWAGGRIDIRGTGDPYGDELGLPIMHGEDYNRFSDWLDTFETDFIWTLDQIVELYERDNPKIRWAEDTFKEIE
jgi:hypothetical protein